MEKIWHALRHGSSRAKRFIWMMIFLALVAVGLVIYAIVGGSFLSGAVALVIGAWIVVNLQSASFESKTKESEGEKDSEGKKKASKDLKGIEAEKNKKEKEDQKEGFSDYTDQEIKKLLVVHKAKKSSKTVMVDRSDTYRIKQCPAYIWRTSGFVNLLLLEKKPRMIKVESRKVKYILHEKGVPVHPGKDYSEFNSPSIVGSIFAQFRPTYYEMTQYGKTIKVKNLYVMEPDIKFTNTSAPALFDVLDVGFKIDDEFIRNPRFNDYFKEAYRFNVLWKDGVYLVNEYKAKIKVLLKRMAEETLDPAELDFRLEQMVRYRLITEEYAEFYSKSMKE